MLMELWAVIRKLHAPSAKEGEIQNTNLLGRAYLDDPDVLVAPGVPEVPDTRPPGRLLDDGSVVMVVVMMMARPIISTTVTADAAGLGITPGHGALLQLLLLGLQRGPGDLRRRQVGTPGT